MRKYIFPFFMLLFAAATWMSAPSIIKFGDRYRANQLAQREVHKYAFKNHAKAPEAKIDVQLASDLETPSKRFRRQAFHVTYSIGQSTSKGTISITFAKVNGIEKPIELYDIEQGIRIKL